MRGRRRRGHRRGRRRAGRGAAPRFGSLTRGRARGRAGRLRHPRPGRVRRRQAIEEATAGPVLRGGQRQLLEGLDEAILGKSAGESNTFQAPLRGGDYTDSGDVTVTVTGGQGPRPARARRRVRPAGERVRHARRAADDLRTKLAGIQDGCSRASRRATRRSRRCSPASRCRCPRCRRPDRREPLRAASARGHRHGKEDGQGAQGHREEFDAQTPRAGAEGSVRPRRDREKEELVRRRGGAHRVHRAQRPALWPHARPVRQRDRELRAGADVVGEVVRAKALALVLERPRSSTLPGATGRPRGAAQEPAEETSSADRAARGAAHDVEETSPEIS